MTVFTQAQFDQFAPEYSRVSRSAGGYAPESDDPRSVAAVRKMFPEFSESEAVAFYDAFVMQD